jgi:UDP-GlcNAc:undecaprenyl-phosphate/decaprenyl-phosphate GlcNAc-1-phosphate transferase
MALLFVLLLATGVFKTGENVAIRAAISSASIVFVFGLLDDYRRQPVAIKFVGQLLAVGVLIFQGIYIRVFESPEFFINIAEPYDRYLGWFVTILWVVGITNAFNFVDSMDGLAVGLGAVAAGFFMIMAYDANQSLLAVQFALIVGICSGLYFFNTSPAIYFLGDSGAQTLGFIMAVLAIVYTPVGAHQASSYLVPLMVLGLPIFDTSLVVLSRLRRGKHIYQAGLDHTYHRLIALGADPSRAVLTMQFSAVMLGSLAFISLYLVPFWANIILLVSLAAAVFFIMLLDDYKRWP